jgi:hypothetical protein
MANGPSASAYPMRRKASTHSPPSAGSSQSAARGLFYLKEANPCHASAPASTTACAVPIAPCPASFSAMVTIPIPTKRRAVRISTDSANIAARSPCADRTTASPTARAIIARVGPPCPSSRAPSDKKPMQEAAFSAICHIHKQGSRNPRRWSEMPQSRSQGEGGGSNAQRIAFRARRKTTFLSSAQPGERDPQTADRCESNRSKDAF